jgi:aldose 1-epimerase
MIDVKAFANSDAKLCFLKNQNGLELVLTNIGASIRNLFMPIRKSKLDIVLGYDAPQDYEENPKWFGSILGRCAARISDAAFKLDGKTYNLDKNDGENCLHSGFDGFSHRFWDIEIQGSKIFFKLESPDGDQGFPGNAQITVDYELTDDNKLVIHYRAYADKTTIFNLSNHAYFNLDGHDSGNIEDHLLELKSSKFLAIDSNSLPTGEIKKVKGTPLDFTKEKRMGDGLKSDFGQIKMAKGYDHTFIIDAPSLTKPFANVRSQKTGIEMSAFTDRPAFQFYTGNFLGAEINKGEAIYLKYGGFCLETQNYPDALRLNKFPSPIYKAGEIFESTTIYEFKLP